MPMRIIEIEWIGRRFVLHNEAHRISDPALFFACQVVVEVSRSLTRKLPQNSVETITTANCLVERGLQSTLTKHRSESFVRRTTECLEHGDVLRQRKHNPFRLIYIVLVAARWLLAAHSPVPLWIRCFLWIELVIAVRRQRVVVIIRIQF